MKTLYALALACSLVLNVTAAWWLMEHAAGSAPPPPAAAAEAPATRPPAITAETWAKLGAGDLGELAARLKASGFPPEMIRAILAAQLGEEYSARRKALANHQDTAFWKTIQLDPKAQLALRQLNREEQKRLRELLGDDAEMNDPLADAYRGRSLNFLPSAKADDVRRIMREYDERRSDLYAGGFDYTTDRAKITALEKEQHAAVAAVLTPAELLDYDLRTSNTARSLRDQLSAFNPSEEEFRAIYALRTPFDERYSNDFFGSLSPDEMKARNDAEKQLAAQIKAGLTPDRAAEYERATDYNYRRTAQLVARLELPPETTANLYAVQKEFEQRRMDVARAAPNAAERVAQLTALQQEAIARVAPLLGSATYVDTYKQYGGNWLQNLVPRQPPGKR